MSGPSVSRKAFSISLRLDSMEYGRPFIFLSGFSATGFALCLKRTCEPTTRHYSATIKKTHRQHIEIVCPAAWWNSCKWHKCVSAAYKDRVINYPWRAAPLGGCCLFSPYLSAHLLSCAQCYWRKCATFLHCEMFTLCLEPGCLDLVYVAKNTG